MKYFTLILILILLYSCEYKKSVQFTEPQPAGINDALSFNKHYQGEYLNPDDSSYLTISPLSVVRHKECTWIFTRLELDSSFKNKSDEEIKTALLKDGMKCSIKK